MEPGRGVPKGAQLPICSPLHGTGMQWGAPDGGALGGGREVVTIRGGEGCTCIWRIYIVSTPSAQRERTTHVQVLSHAPLSSTVKVYPSPSSGAPPIPPIHVFHSPNTQDVPPPSNQVLPLPSNQAFLLPSNQASLLQLPPQTRYFHCLQTRYFCCPQTRHLYYNCLLKPGTPIAVRALA